MTTYGGGWYSRYLAGGTSAGLGPREWLYVPPTTHCWQLVRHTWSWWPYGPQDRLGQQWCYRCGSLRPGVIYVTAEVTQ